MVKFASHCFQGIAGRSNNEDRISNVEGRNSIEFNSKDWAQRFHSFEFWSLLIEIYLKFEFCDLRFNWPHFGRKNHPEFKDPVIWGYLK
jgi:hypothetical protein